MWEGLRPSPVGWGWVGHDEFWAPATRGEVCLLFLEPERHGHGVLTCADLERSGGNRDWAGSFPAWSPRLAHKETLLGACVEILRFTSPPHPPSLQQDVLHSRAPCTVSSSPSPNSPG